MARVEEDQDLPGLRLQERLEPQILVAEVAEVVVKGLLHLMLGVQVVQV